MKTFLILVSISMVFLFSCSRDGNNNVQPNAAVSNVIQQGSWLVSNYSNDGNDRLFLFGGYRFQFGSNGSLTATKGTASAIGTWSTGQSAGVSFIFFDFESTPSFNQLNGNWPTISVNSGQIKLKRISLSGSGGNDFLDFDAF